MDIDVTVGIVNYNDYNSAKEAIRSIIENTHEVKVKIYLVDNDSKDKSGQRLADEFSQINVIFSDKNLGYGAAHNLMLDKIDSEFYAIVNPDIVLDQDVLAQLCSFMRKNQDIGMCTPKILYTNGDVQYLPKRNPKLKYLIANRLPLKRYEQMRKHYKMTDEDLTKPIDVEFVTGCFMFARTEVLRAVHGFDERYFMYFEDADLTRTIRNTGLRTVYTPDTYVYHDYSRASAKKLKFLMIHIFSMFQYFIKWRKNSSN
ncbi:MAG: glycosyltransferase family 2 protein [Christensenellaceae bacterium]